MPTNLLDHQNFNHNEIQNAVTQNLAGAPPSPKPGQRYFDTTLDQEGYYNGSGWVYPGASNGNVSQSGTSASSGILKVSAGANANITDYTGGTGLLKSSASGVVSPAVAGTDYLAPAGSGAALTGLTQSQVAGLVAALALLAPLASPTFTGVPVGPTAAAGTNTTQLANTAFVQAALSALAQGLQPKPTATVATVTALPANTYANGASGVGATLTGSATGVLTVDTHVVALNDIVLVLNEATAANNGLYTCTTAGASGTAYVLTRHADMATAAEFAGAFIPVGNAGSVTANSLWLCNPSGAVTVGTTSIPFSQLNGATDLVQGTGITISGNTVSLATLKGKYTAMIGDGSSTTITVTDGLGTIDKTAVIRDATTGAEVGCTITYTSTGVSFTFASAPAANAYKVVIIG